MIKTDDWKLLIYPKAQVVRLYHCSADPHELHDVADDPQNALIMDGLFLRLQKLQQENDDKLDLTPVYAEFKSRSGNTKTTG